jgi:excisionase family DNA binding protein
LTVTERTTPGEQWLTTEEAAELLGMSPVWVRERRKAGALKAKKISNAGRGRYRFSRTALDEFMSSLPDD